MELKLYVLRHISGAYMTKSGDVNRGNQADMAIYTKRHFAEAKLRRNFTVIEFDAQLTEVGMS